VKRPYFDSLQLIYFSDALALEHSLQAQQIDIFAPLAPDQIDSIVVKVDTAVFEPVESWFTTSVFALFLNTAGQRNPTALHLLRWLAVDSTLLAQGALASGLLPMGLGFKDEPGLNDTTASNRIFSDASQSFPEKNTLVTLAVSRTDPLALRLATGLQRRLQADSVQIVINPEQPDALHFSKSSADLFLLQLSIDHNDASTRQRATHQLLVTAAGLLGQQIDEAVFASPMAAQSASEPLDSSGKAAGSYKELFWRTMPFVPVGASRSIYYVHRSVGNRLLLQNQGLVDVVPALFRSN